MTVSFCTPTVLDLEMAFTFGVSAKTTDDAIGFFGTGLKFAVATLLRTGHTIEISIQGQKHRFELQQNTYRNKVFQMVTLNGKSLGFTTELGKLWEVWMAFRELYSNTLDEKGTTTQDRGALDSNSHGTVIEVTGTAIDQAYHMRETIFCLSPIVANSPGYTQLHSGKAKHLYYRGVRVMDIKQSSLFTYNMTLEQVLTEDRTFKYQGLAEMWLKTGIALIDNKAVLQEILMAPETTYEGNMDFSSCSSVSPQFLEIVRECGNDKFLNKSALKLGLKLGAIKEELVELDDIQKMQMKKAVDFLKKIGFVVTRYPIVVCEMQAGQHGLAKNGTIYVAPQAFRMGTKYLAATIYEEFLHLSEGVYDETRAMQTMLFDTIMSMGEKLVGEPL